MEKRVVFIGDNDLSNFSVVFHNLLQKFDENIEKLIIDGYTHFMMAMCTKFDQLAFNACLKAKQKYPNIKIEVAFPFYRDDENADTFDFIPYKDIYFAIFNTNEKYYYSQIERCYKKMLDFGGSIICFDGNEQRDYILYYVLRYANNADMEIINLFEHHKDDSDIGVGTVDFLEYVPRKNK